LKVSRLLIGIFCGAVDSFDEGKAAAAFGAVAKWGAILLDGLEKIFEDGLVSAEIADGGGGGALIFVARGIDEIGRSVAEIGGDDAVVFKDDGASGAGDFDAARIAGEGGGGGVEAAEGAGGEFESGDGGVFGFDFVEESGGAGLHASDVAEEPEEKIDGVNGLVDEGAAAIESESAAPAGGGVIVGRAVPLDAGIDEENFAEKILVEPGFELADVGFGAVLKNYGKFCIGFFCGVDKGVGASGGDFEWLFDEYVETSLSGSDALRGVEAGGAAEDDEIHGAMLEEGGEVREGSAAVFAAEAGDFFGIGAVNGGDFDIGNGAGGARVSFGDVAAADEADVDGHGEFSVVSFQFSVREEE